MAVAFRKKRSKRLRGVTEEEEEVSIAQHKARGRKRNDDEEWGGKVMIRGTESPVKAGKAQGDFLRARAACNTAAGSRQMPNTSFLLSSSH